MGASAGQVQRTIRHCHTEYEHAKERWIASTESCFSVYAKLIDEQVEGFFFFFYQYVHVFHVSERLFRFL